MNDAVQVISSPLIRQLMGRGSCRSFKPDPVPDAMIRTILTAACRAPSSCNQESYSIIVVRDPAVKQRVYEICWNQKHILEAPVLLCFCADINRVKWACEGLDKPFGSEDTLEMGMVSTVEAALVGMCASLAAESLGLGTVMLGAMRNDPIEVARLLNLPKRSYCVYGLSVGWPAQPTTIKPRLPYETVVHHERFDGSRMKEGVAQYDETLADYYRAIGKPTAPNSWTAHMIKQFSAPRRPELRDELRQLGFEFR